MIKFWKSAAKGKSGCPVRPPEKVNSDNVNNTSVKKFCLETISEYEELDINIFTKKSRLSITLQDVLMEKNILKYFLKYVESLGNLLLVKCLIELENFRQMVVSNDDLPKATENHSKITRTQSFDHERKSNKPTENTSAFRRHSCMMAIDPVPQTSECSNVQNKDVWRQISENDCCINNDCADCTNQNYSTDIVQNAVTLFKKYVALEATFKIDIPENVRKAIISNICQPEGLIKQDCFKAVQDLVFDKIESTYFDDFQKSPLYRKAQIDILTNCSLTLKDILYNETILFFFTEFLEQESASVLLEFLIAVMHFRDNLIDNDTHDPNQTQDDAIILYDKYFSLQATTPIGFSTDIRLKVESDICREGGPLFNCFDYPYQIVYKTLSFYVQSFLESEIYYNYLSEMVHSVDETWLTHKKAYSDCSSEFSISTQNTLLAMGDPAFKRRRRNHSVPDMTIDSNQLYNADSLWQRTRHEGLNLGRVNSLGRFESKFEPDPDKKDKSVLKKMVSRFVPVNKSQVEEEMAWQIAHMIVKDITDLTMAPPDNET